MRWSWLLLVVCLLHGGLASGAFSTVHQNIPGEVGSAANHLDIDRAGHAYGRPGSDGGIVIHPSLKEVPLSAFDRSGSVLQYVVPPSVNVISIKAWGGGGGASELVDSLSPKVDLADKELDESADSHKNDGGGGGFIQSTFVVTPGEVLEVRIGGGGKLRTAGWNGGGSPGSMAAGMFSDGFIPHRVNPLTQRALSFLAGGGGASDVRRKNDGNLLITAAGGGGAGSPSEQCCTSGGEAVVPLLCSSAYVV